MAIQIVAGGMQIRQDMTIAQTVTTAQTALMPDMGEISQLRAELERERTKRKQAETQVLMMRAEVAQAQKEARERIARAEAEAKQRADAELSEELMRIITAANLSPNQRLVLGMVYHAGRQLQAKGKAAVVEMSGREIAKRLGMSAQTACDSINALKSIGLCQTGKQVYFYDQSGNEIDPKTLPSGTTKSRAKMKAAGIRCESDSWVTPVTALPSELQTPQPTTYQAKAKAKASEIRALAQMAIKVEAATCPVCNKSGGVHIACKCGATLTAETLAKMAIKADESEQADPDTIEAVRSSDDRRKSETVQNSSRYIFTTSKKRACISRGGHLGQKPEQPPYDFGLCAGESEVQTGVNHA